MTEERPSTEDQTRLTRDLWEFSTMTEDAFTSRQLRDVLGTFITGVTIVTTRDRQGTGHGITANSFSSVSLDPPLILWSLACTSKSFKAFQESSHFAVHILAEDQMNLSNHFSKSREDKFHGIPHTAGFGDVPILENAAARLECSRFATHPAGDHVIYIGRVERIALAPRRTLAFASGKYAVARAFELNLLHKGEVQSPVGPGTINRAISLMPMMAAQMGGFTLCLAAWANHGPTIIHWESSSLPPGQKMAAGEVVGVTQSAIGLIFAAFMPPEQTGPFTEDDLRHAPSLGADAAAPKDVFEQQLVDIQSKGYARSTSAPTSDTEAALTTTLAVPILDPEGEGILALAVVSYSSCICGQGEDVVARMLLKAAREISAR